MPQLRYKYTALLSSIVVRIRRQCLILESIELVIVVVVAVYFFDSFGAKCIECIHNNAHVSHLLGSIVPGCCLAWDGWSERLNG